MRFKYSEEHVKFLRKGFKKKRIPKLTAAFNKKFGLARSEDSIKAALKNRKISCGRKGGHMKGHKLSFTKNQIKWIKEEYLTQSPAEMVDEFNLKFGTQKTARQIRSFIHNHGINSGRTGCFEKGNKPWNTGTKGLVKPNSGNFKKGTVPPNWQPVGSERVNNYGYLEVKINEPNPYVPGQMTRWKLKHIILWEKEHGLVPDGHIVIFLDSDKMNCVPDNLMLISKKVNAYLNRNGYGNLPADLKMSAIALAKVAQKASYLEKKEAA